jgi:hypothetical protein
MTFTSVKNACDKKSLKLTKGAGQGVKGRDIVIGPVTEKWPFFLAKRSVFAGICGSKAAA